MEFKEKTTSKVEISTESILAMTKHRCRRPGGDVNRYSLRNDIEFSKESRSSDIFVNIPRPTKEIVELLDPMLIQYISGE